jgi:hypothetical protein
MLKLKNKNEREDFVKNYRSWGVWKQIHELNLTFYRYDFVNGAALVVTEYQYYSSWKKECETRHKMCLILPSDDKYTDNSPAYGAELYKFYDPTGCSMGTIVDYMTKSKGFI